METTRDAPAVWADRDQPADARIADLLARLTVEEKVALMAGQGAFTLHGVERLGIAGLRMADGPTGVRSNEGEAATVFPTGVALASTWNPDLVGEVAGAIAREARALDDQVILAPTINIVRSPLWGRNFETYSEDPFLTGALGTAFVRGLQAEGVGASLKHYAVNNQETRRMDVDAVVDERTLREIYLAAFETVVREANPWTVMASYNRINGPYATENVRLLEQILKGEWGYDGVVVSDWGAVHATGAAAAGTDLEMPGPPVWFGEKLLAAARAGEISAARIDDAARRVLRLMLRTGLLDQAPRPAGELRSKRHREIAARAAEESVVLLKNDADLLPLDPGRLRRLAVVGPNAAVRRIQGGGSSHVRPGRRTSVLQSLEERLGASCEVVYADGGDNEPAPPAAAASLFSPDEARGQAGLGVAYFHARGFAEAPFKIENERAIGKLLTAAGARDVGAVRWSGWFWPERDGVHEIALRAPGEGRITLAGETLIDPATPGALDDWDVGGGLVPRRVASRALAAGRGYPISIDYVRPAMEMRPAWEYVAIGVRQPRGSVEEAAELAAGADAAVVVIGAASITEGEGYDRRDLLLPGDQNALVEAVLAANPRTVVVLLAGAPYAMPWIEHAPAVVAAWLGGEEGPDALSRILLGDTGPSGRLPMTIPRAIEDTPAHRYWPGGDQAIYGEGLHVGYRHFDRSPIPPLFPFGHGLTYTRFHYAGLEAPEEARVGQAVRVDFMLTNAGERAGKETAQLYVRARGPSVERPVKELKSFVKVALAAGERQKVTLTLRPRDFAYWDPTKGAWTVEPGSYDLLVGGSAADIELQATVRLAS